MIEDPAPTDSVIGACEAAIREGQPKVAPPGTLYHLTDVDGLSGIAGNKCLWASLATTLNDCQEIRYGVALAEEVIEKRLLGRRDEYHSSLLTYVRTPTSHRKRCSSSTTRSSQLSARHAVRAGSGYTTADQAEESPLGFHRP